MTNIKTLIEREFDAFFEFETDNRDVVTSTSARLFAEHVVGIVAIPAQPAVQGEPVAPEGFRLIAVNETFDGLAFWLDRCEQKGHLENCADLVEPWEEFEYREVEAPQPAEQQPAPPKPSAT